MVVLNSRHTAVVVLVMVFSFDIGPKSKQYERVNYIICIITKTSQNAPNTHTHIASSCGSFYYTLATHSINVIMKTFH